MYIYLCILYIYHADDWLVHLFYLYMPEGTRSCNSVALKSETYTLAVVVFTLYNALPLRDIEML